MPKDTLGFKLINIIGIDGAGKTTLATSLAGTLQQVDDRIEYRYCQYFAKLLYPLKLAARLSVMRKTDEFKDYKEYIKTKKSTSSRFPLLAQLYAYVWAVDYILQVFFKVVVPRFFGRKLIIDRYVFDISVNLSLTTNNDLNYAEKLIQFFFRFLPVPDLIMFVDVPEEVAFARKDDIQDIEYLRERRERYLALGERHGFVVLDGTKNREDVLADAVGAVKSL